MLAGPFLANRRRRIEAGHPVDERAAAHPRAGEHRDRAVPGGEQTVVQVQLSVRVQLVMGHRGFVHVWSGLDDQDATSGPRQLGGHDASARPGTHDHHVSREPDRGIAALRDRAVHLHRPDRSELRWQRRIVADVADRARQRVRGFRRARIRVSDEGQELAERVHAGAAEEQRRVRPAQQQAFARRRVHVAERGEPAAGCEIREGLLQHPQDQPELDQLRWIDSAEERIGCDRCDARGVGGGDER